MFKSPTTIEPVKPKITAIPLTNSAAAMLRDFLDDYSLTQAKLAADLHISPQLLNDILASRRLLTPEHCLKLGRYFGNEPEYWMRLQNHCSSLDISHGLSCPCRKRSGAGLAG